MITPSHNPPRDGGFKYNPPHGGPADSDVTSWIEDRANALLRSGIAAIKRVPFAAAIRASTTLEVDFVEPYVADLASVIDMKAIRAANSSSASTPWAARPSITGSRSPIVMAWTSPSPTRRSIPRSGS